MPDKTPSEPSDSLSEHAELYVPLPKPPQALSFNVRRLINKVQEGAIRVPTFQRPLRWTSTDVAKLFDSILKGYPVGSLLFWKHRFERAEIQIGSATLSADATDDGWFIVDGQQRMTALAASLLDLDQKDDKRWDLSFDVRTNKIRTGTTDLHLQVPLKVLGDLRRLGRWLRDCDLESNEQTRVEEVQQRILDFELPAYLMETENVDALRGVFARLNSTGVRMRADEVFQALLGSTNTQPSREPHLDLVALQKAADIDGFGEPPRGEILKAVLAMSGLDPTKRLDHLKEASVSKMVSQDEAAEAIRLAVTFLQTPLNSDEPGAEIPAYALIPYPVVFVILSRWFHLFPETDETTRRALVQWLWRGVLTGVHYRAEVSAMRLQVRDIRNDEMAASLERLLKTVGAPAAREWTLKNFNGKRASSRAEVLALLSLVPRDLDGPVSWRAFLAGGARGAREFFRVKEFTDSPTQKKARTAANRVLLDETPNRVLETLRNWKWPANQEILESHLVDQAAHAYLQAEHAREFLEHRSSKVRTHVSSFIAKRAGLDGPTVLALKTYLDDEDNRESR
jgi:Protein of unknown function DUF262